MSRTVRATAVVAALSLVVAACTSGTATPSPVSPATPSTAPSASASTGPTLSPRPSGPHLLSLVPTTKPTPAATPTPGPTPVHGQYLLYDSNKSLPDDSFQPQVWLIKPNGTGARMIAQADVYGPFSPSRFTIDAVWSHDGSVVHILRYPTEDPNACVPHLSDLPIGGGPEVPKVTLTNHDSYFFWSPDDGKIVYRHYQEDEICEQNGLSLKNDLVVMNADGSGRRTVRTNIPYRVTAWMPDGSALLAVNDSGAWLKVSLTDGATTPLGLTADRAEVSPNGSKIGYLKSGHLYVRNLSGGSSKDFGAATDFAWSPSSNTLAIFGSHLTMQSASTAVGLTLYSGTGSSPTWAPDFGKIAFR